LAESEKRPRLSGARFCDLALSRIRSPATKPTDGNPIAHFGAARRMLFSAALLSALCGPCAQVFAANSTPNKAQISIETKYVEISLTLDSELKNFPELFASCLAEGKAWVNKTNADATEEWRDNRKAFRGLQWFYDRDYVLRSVVGRYVSVVRSDDWFDGGAHPNAHADTILWDNVAHKRTNIRALFTETADNGPTMAALTQAAKFAVATAKPANDINGYGDDDRPDAKDMTPAQEIEHDSFIKDGIKPALLEIGPITLAPSTETGKSSGLTFHYSPYGVGPYVEGPYTVFVPWTAFRQYLSPQGAALFGGERPKSDEEKW
jgi:hypothetical protein